MTSYVRTSTGAVCQLPLPSQLAQNPSFSSLTRIDELPIIRADESGDLQAGSAFISVPYEYCSYGRNINPSVFPELFSLLNPKTKQLAEEGLYKPTSMDSSDVRARFYEGFDLSGHVFLLFASLAIITRQLAPALKMLYERGVLLDAPGKKISGVQLAGHALTIVGGLGLISIWSFVSGEDPYTWQMIKVAEPDCHLHWNRCYGLPRRTSIPTLKRLPDTVSTATMQLLHNDSG